MAPRPLVSRRFHELFHSPPGVLFSVRSPYYSLSVYQEYLALEGGPPRFTPGVTGLALLRYRIERLLLRLQASHLSRAPFQTLRLAASDLMAPALQPRGAGSPVWARPRSLAATSGVSFDFLSSGYLDVSVRLVRFPLPTERNTMGSPWWVAPFGHPGITASVRLPPAFRSLARPSSLLVAGQSPVCP